MPHPTMPFRTIGDKRIISYREGAVWRILGRHRVSDERRVEYWLHSIRSMCREGMDPDAYVVARTLLDAYNSDTGESRIPMGLLTEISNLSRLGSLESLYGHAFRHTTPRTTTDYHAALRQLEDGGFISIIPGRGRVMNRYTLHLPTAEACREWDAQTNS
jgi:hypothetical protein